MVSLFSQKPREQEPKPRASTTLQSSSMKRRSNEENLSKKAGNKRGNVAGQGLGNDKSAKKKVGAGSGGAVGAVGTLTSIWQQVHQLDVAEIPEIHGAPLNQGFRDRRQTALNYLMEDIGAGLGTMNWFDGRLWCNPAIRRESIVNLLWPNNNRSRVTSYDGGTKYFNPGIINMWSKDPNNQKFMRLLSSCRDVLVEMLRCGYIHIGYMLNIHPFLVQTQILAAAQKALTDDQFPPPQKEEAKRILTQFLNTYGQELDLDIFQWLHKEDIEYLRGKTLYSFSVAQSQPLEGSPEMSRCILQIDKVAFQSSSSSSCSSIAIPLMLDIAGKHFTALASAGSESLSCDYIERMARQTGIKIRDIIKEAQGKERLALEETRKLETEKEQTEEEEAQKEEAEMSEGEGGEEEVGSNTGTEEQTR